MNTKKWKAYWRLMRFDRPIGIYLLLWPTLWSLWIAAEGWPTLKILIIFILGVIFMRASGCAINDYADRHIDGKVTRTKTRPLVSGEIKPAEALACFVIMSALSFGLVLLLNPLTIQFACIAVIFTAIYPFMKRFVDWPQLFLGLAFAWSVPMAFAAQQGAVPWAAWIIFLTAIIFPVAYDTLYAMADQKDDEKAGIRSTAIFFGNKAPKIVLLAHFITLALLVWVGYYWALGLWFYASLFVAGMMFIYQQVQIRDRNPEACFRAFVNNHWAGAVIFLGIFLHYTFH